MSDPSKPWVTIDNQNTEHQMNNVWNRSQQNIPGNNPPPIPPRPYNQANQMNHVNPLSHFGNGFGLNSNMMSPHPFGSAYSSPYHNPMYNAYSGINRGYSNYMTNSFGSSNGPENDFIRLAEESSSQAFQSIESIVQAFASVSMMLESTYFAVHSSFRAVLGVADHFSRLKNHLAHVFSTLAIVRTLNWIFKRILQLLGLSHGTSKEDIAWQQANSVKPENESLVEILSAQSSGKSSWPILIFFGVVLGTPWLIWRLLASITGTDKPTSSQWMKKKGNHFIATSLYDFQTDHPREISFNAGEQIVVAPKELQPRIRGWLLASVDGIKTGLIPTNYIKFNDVQQKNAKPNA